MDDRIVGKKRKLDIKKKTVGISEDVVSSIRSKEQMDVENQQQQLQIENGQLAIVPRKQRQTFYNALPIAASLLPRRYPKNTRLRKLL